MVMLIPVMLIFMMGLFFFALPFLFIKGRWRCRIGCLSIGAFLSIILGIFVAVVIVAGTAGFESWGRADPVEERRQFYAVFIPIVIIGTVPSYFIGWALDKLRRNKHEKAVQALRADDRDVGRSAAEALGNIGEPAKESVPALITVFGIFAVLTIPIMVCGIYGVILGINLRDSHILWFSIILIILFISILGVLIKVAVSRQ